ncbi:MAG: tRNA-dihydrouridine synthase [Candidatus Methanomethylophilaceae archaeon]|nr:tRNA-dihydrouridine synthase [Candidatus Methanomethylophilaceae archaeon]
MVARGGIGNPNLVRQIDSWFRSGERVPNPTVRQQIAWCKELSEAVIEEKGETIGVKKLRSIAPKFLSGCRWSVSRKRLATEPETKADLFALLDAIEEESGDRTVGRPERDVACAHDDD